jgi:hypothetical protein
MTPTISPAKCPPGSAHPDFADQPYLRAWIDDPHGRNSATFVDPIPAIWVRDSEIAAPARNLAYVLDRCRVVGPAPYVGRPFVYLWDVAVDRLGRWIAGPSYIVYRDGALP